MDTRSDARSAEIVSKPRSKKRPNKAKKKKPKATASSGRGTSRAAPPPEAVVERTKGFNPSRMWTNEAKREAVALLERGDASIERIAAELGVTAKTLRDWQALFEQEENDTPMTAEERRQFARLRKENERLRMECEILKKAATFFARHRS